MNTLIHIEHVHYHKPIVDFINAVAENKLKHYASDLFPELEITDEEIANISIQRATQVCTTLKLPINEHFRKVYRTSGNKIYCDYKLSHLAYLLVGINGDVKHFKVAKMQMELVKLILDKI